jgi:hypothetical protein
LRVKLYNEDLVNPIENEKVESGNGIKDRHSGRIGHDGPYRGKKLSVYIISRHFRCCVKIFQVCLN